MDNALIKALTEFPTRFCAVKRRMQQRRLPFSRASLLSTEEGGEKRQDEDRQGLLAKYAAHGNSYVTAKHAHRRRRMEEDEKGRRKTFGAHLFFTHGGSSNFHAIPPAECSGSTKGTGEREVSTHACRTV